MALVSLDTMVLVWALRKTATPGQEYRLQEAENLLTWITQFGHKILIAAPAAGEYLTGLTDSERASAFQVLSKHYFVKPFDLAAAALAAQIQTNLDMKAFASGNQIPYPRLKTDTEIIATSIIGTAAYFITEDTALKTVHAGSMVVKTMKEAYSPLVQSRLPRDTERSLWDTPVEDGE